MNYEEARAFIEESPRYGEKPGLDAIRKLLDEAGHPEKSLLFIHIAGTNGKGSVLAHISTVLTLAGYRVGRYISPTIYSYQERIQVNGMPITREDFTRLAEVLKVYTDYMEKSGLRKPSPFELETVLGFLYFKEQGCDYVVLECGLGGLHDATNVIPMENKKLAVLTSISMDHMEYLGDTLEKITLQKAGIIGPGVPVVSAPQKPEARDALYNYCARNGYELKETDLSKARLTKRTLEGQSFRYDGQEIRISLAGEPQIENAVTAYEALQMMIRHGLKLKNSQIVEGMAATRWEGRFTRISENPDIFVDGAHNPDAAEKLRMSIEEYLAGRRLIFINGMFSDKDYDTVARITAPLAEQIFTIATSGNARALSPEKLAAAISKYHTRVMPCATIGDAVNAARLAAGKDGVIVCFGSLSFIGELTAIVQGKRNQEEFLCRT